MRMMSPGLQLVVVLNPLAVDERAVAAIEIAQRPLALRLKHFGVVAAAALVLDDDRVGRRTADRDRLAVDQPEHVGPFRAFANNQVCRHRIQMKRSRNSRSRPAAALPQRHRPTAVPDKRLPMRHRRSADLRRNVRPITTYSR